MRHSKSSSLFSLPDSSRRGERGFVRTYRIVKEEATNIQSGSFWRDSEEAIILVIWLLLVYSLLIAAGLVLLIGSLRG